MELLKVRLTTPVVTRPYSSYPTRVELSIEVACQERISVPQPYDWNDTTFKEFPTQEWYSLEVGRAKGSQRAWGFCFWQVQAAKLGGQSGMEWNRYV
jgi:hypothetical protein